MRLSKLVSFLCVAAVLFIVNTNFVPSKLRFSAVAVFLAIGFLAFVIGVICVSIIPRMERVAMRESGTVSPLDQIHSGRGRGEA